MIVANGEIIEEDEEFYHKFEYYDKINRVSCGGGAVSVIEEI